MAHFELGAHTFDAAKRLKNSEDWQAILAGLHEQTAKLMHNAIASAAADACGYARGVRDVLNTLEILESDNAVVRKVQQPVISTRRPKD
jgi:hypothetical protein